MAGDSWQWKGHKTRSINLKYRTCSRDIILVYGFEAEEKHLDHGEVCTIHYLKKQVKDQPRELVT